MKKLLATIVTAVCAAFGASAETIRLDDVQYNITVRDGDVLTGRLTLTTPTYIPKLTVEDGATVTISNAVIHGHTYNSGEYYISEHSIIGTANDFDWAGITCAGSATIVLKGVNTVKGCQTAPAIYVPEAKQLTIKGDGVLVATSGGASAAIGGGMGRPCGNIAIEGGDITAAAVKADWAGYGAGIGGGSWSRCGNIDIRGGIVVATACSGAAIGSGDYGTCGDIAISGGSVSINQTSLGETSIGSGKGGSCGNITVSGGAVVASGAKNAAGIGTGMSGSCGDIVLSGGDHFFFGRSGGAVVGSGTEGTCGRIAIETGLSRVSIRRSGPDAHFTASSGIQIAGDLVKTQQDPDTLVYVWNGNLATRTCNATAFNGMELYGTLSGNYKVSIAAGATVTLNGITINGADSTDCRFAGLNLLGDATLILSGGKVNTVSGFYRFYPGVHVPSGRKLKITGSGTLQATSGGGARGVAAGIGASYAGDYHYTDGACGDIEINGGVVIASGGNGAAGIGCAYAGTCGNIKISAGITRVVATAGKDASGHNVAQPIGNGWYGSGANVTVAGGMTDTTSDGTRTIMPEWDGDLSQLNANADVTAYDGMTIFGRMANKAKVSIADGATVTLRSIDIQFQESDANCLWAGLTCKGNATLILEGVNWVEGFCDNYPGIYIPQNKTLTIKGGGALNAFGKNRGAGIGGGSMRACGNIDIQGGFIYAYGEGSAAGIGGGYNAACGNIHIAASVAKVLATSGEDAPNNPIGAGKSGTGGTVTVDSGVKDETSTDGRTRTITWNGDLSNLTGDMTAVNGTVIHGTLSGKYKVTIAADAAVTLDNAVIAGGLYADCPWAGLTCEGHATITLAGDNVANGFHEDFPGIYVPSGKTLTINGSGTATLFASSIYGAGIGGGADQACGNVNIQRGIVTAVGGLWSAGIGSGRGKACGTITIGTGVTRVMATCGNNATSPIGAGYGGSGGAVTVNGVGTSLTDTTSGKTRTICWNGDLSLTSGDGRTAFHGMTLYKSLASGALRKFDIEAGATVTISNATINGTNSSDAKWAGLTCKGDATINLVGSSTVTGFYEDYPGIHVPTNATLTIRGAGSLTASGSVGTESKRWAAGIGGGFGQACGSIVIEGGTITATGGNNAAGIGGGMSRPCGDISILGGTVNATGGEYAAGIGGGSGQCGTITIGQGITRVVATCGTGATLPIGAGKNGSGGEVVLDGVFEDVTSGTTRTIMPAWDGNLSTLDHNVTAMNGTVIHGTLAGQYKVSIADGATVTLSNATITCGNNNASYGWAGLTCLGSAGIILKKTNIVKGFYEDYPGIHVPEGKMLVIQGTGSLTASSNGYGAGIGGGYNIACGDIAVMSGTIEATGGNRAAGIGGGYRSACGNIMIGGIAVPTYGGANVTATGGVSGAGIGGGDAGSCSNITIVGSTTRVDARGGSAAAGVGSGLSGTCGNVNICAGTIGAIGGQNAAGIGSGNGTSAKCGTVTIMADQTATTRVTATSGNSDAAAPIGAGSSATCDGVSVAASLYDDHGSPTRFISVEFPWDGNLSTLDHDATARDGTVIHGTLGGSYKVSIADGATVTLSNAVINADGSLEGSFAGLTCEGNATIVLLGENTVKAFHNFYPGIYVPADMTLTIQGTGSLTANAHSGDSWAAGIGGGYSYGSVYLNCGNIVIAGGTVVANGGFRSAGIGGGYRGTCGDITIGAGIKSVVATRGMVDVEGFVVEAIGAGFDGNRGTVTVDSSLYDDDGDPTRTIMKDPPWDGNLATLTRDATAQNGTVIHGTLAGNYKVSIADGATVTLSNAVINRTGEEFDSPGLRCLGNATILLDGANNISGFDGKRPGIFVPASHRLVISNLNANASLDVLRTSLDGGAGIGGGSGESCGDIDIYGGAITVVGGWYSAGIGGSSKDTSCGTIRIMGGAITATGGFQAAGIGSGNGGSCTGVAIEGGTVSATGGGYGAGIGAGDGLLSNHPASCGDITIGSGIVCVTATRGAQSTASEPIGRGATDSSCGTVTLGTGLTDSTSADGNTRTITQWVWDGNLATLTRDATAQDGTVIYGTLAGNYKVSIAAGATVTLSNASINASGNLSGAWAGLTCLAGDNLETTIILEGVNNIHSLGADYPGIQVEESTRFRGLNIKGDGELVASASINGRGAGIGGAVGMDNGAIVIESGTVTATGGAGAAGIGSAADRFSNGIVMITGGSVTASGGAGAAGIGCGAGEEAGFAGVAIYGGTVVATGGAGAAGIGKGAQAGDCGDIEVRPYYDGAFRVVATAGAGGVAAIDRSGDGLGVDVDESLFDRTEGSTRTIWRWDGNLAEVYRDTTVTDDMTLYGELAGQYKISIADGVTVTLNNAIITNGLDDSSCSWAGITCLGDAEIILAPGTVNVVKGFFYEYPGIYVPVDSTLTIDGSGSLTASSNGFGAGIGAGYGLTGSGVPIPCGNIRIEGGTITAIGGGRCAGIGGGNRGSTCGDIEILGGTITAIGGDYGAGIGGGDVGSCGDITIGAGVTRVVATAGAGYGTQPIGGGDEAVSCGDVTVDPSLTDDNGNPTRTITSASTPPPVWNGDLATLTGNVTIESDMTIYGELAGQYKISIADGVTVTLDGAAITNGVSDSDYSWAGLTCLGDAEIVLAAGSANFVKGFRGGYPGIYVPENKTLTISGSGSLDASSNGFGAGIGGGGGIYCGSIVIEGGVITATGGFESAGIGGGSNADCGDITITGGQVTATGGNDAAGIGSGDAGHCSSITISGGTVVATGDSAAGIGTGYAGVCGAISITGGDVTATGGNFSAGIGGGNSGSCGDIAITGGSVTATGDSYAAGIGTGDYTSSCGAITIGADIVRVVATSGSAGTEPIGKGASSSASCGTVTVDPGLTDDHGDPTRTITSASTPPPVWNGDLATLTGDVTVESDMTIYGTLAGQYKISIADGVTVTLDGADITCGQNGEGYAWAGLTCLGDAEIVLAAGSANFVKGFYEVYPGIFVPAGSTLTIGGSGSLDAGSNGDGAGIGGGYRMDCGSIVIEGGVITATGGYESAGIGAGSDAACGTITITGGQVTATGGSYAAGIGTGDYTSSCGAITITGGSVTATGGTKGSGIGSADDSSSCGAITIGTDIVRVVATRGDENAAPIGKGAGDEASCGTVTVDPSLTDDHGDPTRTITSASTPPPPVWNGDLATLTGNVTVESDMTIYGELAGQYKISIADGVTVTLDGAAITNGMDASGYSWAGLTCLGDAEVVLAAGSANFVKGFYKNYPGIYVPENKTLTISGSGSLDARSNGQGAGIGAGSRTACGNIVINGGRIAATGGTGAAGIGSGRSCACGNIMIAGGSVTATGGNYAAGIGTGDLTSSCGNIAIAGGSVTATGGRNGAGIGSGDDSSRCGDITIGVGIVRVVATRGDEDAEPIGKGAGSSASCGTVTVDSSLTDDNGSPTRTITGGGSSSDYAAWATANGVSGAWDAVDANGVANVFRYAFNKPSGAFTEPVLLDITFNAQGRAVILTPPLVNTAGFTFTIGASDNVDGTGNAASYPLNDSGETVIDETGKTTRFFRLRAVTQ